MISIRCVDASVEASVSLRASDRKFQVPGSVSVQLWVEEPEGGGTDAIADSDGCRRWDGMG